MLLNLSNHPASAWPENQKTLAHKLYGRVEDLAFPNISPHWPKAEVAALADEYLKRVQALQPQAIHLMGEMTFCYALIQLLQQAGITCLASTTERIVTEENGKKIVQFQFVKFRDY